MIRLALTRINVVQLLNVVLCIPLAGLLFCSLPSVALSQSLATEYLKKLASDATAGDEYGVAVAIEGDWAVVGAQSEKGLAQVFDLGSVYLYYRHQGGLGRWGEVKKLVPTTPGTGNRFLGAALAISGDIIVVGAYQPDQANAGAVYVFQQNRGGMNQWGQVKMITPSDGVPGDQFGYAVDIDGDTIVVGANKADANSSVRNSGAAYVYQRNAGGSDQWGEIRKLAPAMPFENDLFGEAVSIHGGTIAVGVPGDDDFMINGGSVCLFDRDQGGVDQWGFLRKIISSPVFASDQVGNAVDLFGDTLVVGASLADTTDVNTGAAYVFQRDKGGTNQWGQVRPLLASPMGGDQFGYSVGIYADEIVVGAPYGDRSVSTAGSIYRFKRNLGGADQWGLAGYLGASDAASGDRLGDSVWIHGDLILAGASGNADAGSKTGAAYLYWFPPVAPALSISVEGGNAIISWDPPSSEFVLQWTESLDPAVWTSAPSGSTNPAVIPMDQAAGYFRLALP